MQGNFSGPAPGATLDYTTGAYLRRLQIDHLFDKWSQNAQNWFSQTLIPTVMSAHRQNLGEIDGILERINGSTRDPVVYARSEDERKLRSSAKRVGLGDLFRFHESMGEISFDEFGPQDRTRFFQALCSRQILDRYFNLPDSRQTDPNYIVERMYAALKDHQTLRCVHQNDSIYPSDAKIIAHWIFSCINNANNLDALPNFDILDEFVVPYPQKPGVRSGFTFYQSTAEPYYDVLFEGEVIKLPPGDLHMFSAFALWLHWVRTQHQGVWKSFDCRTLIKQIVPIF